MNLSTRKHDEHETQIAKKIHAFLSTGSLQPRSQKNLFIYFVRKIFIRKFYGDSYCMICVYVREDNQ